jgi:hypothetical protein
VADDERDWIDALAGRPCEPNAQLATVKEGAVVRQAILASQRPLPRFDAESGVRRLLARLRDEKLFDGSVVGHFGWKMPAAAAAVALAIAFIIAIRETPPRDPRLAKTEIPAMTGDPDAAQEMVTVDAREIADELRTMMAQAQLNPTVTEIGGLTRLEADWPRRPSEEQLEFLRNYGLARPAGQRLKIEVRRPQQ